MNAPEILIAAPIRPVVLDALAGFTIHLLHDQIDLPAFWRDIGPRIRGVATSTLFGRTDAALFDRLPNLEIVSSFGVGYDNVDVAAATCRGIVVTNTPGVLDDEVADLAIGLLLATVRQIPQADRHVREGRWEKSPFPLSPTLRGRRIGIVGLGNIGKAIARRLGGFDVRIAWHGRNEQPEVPYPYHPTLIGLARAVDVLITIVPGGVGTRHLIDAPVLEALGPEGIFINVSRGSVIDEQALIVALRSGTILAAGLDVYEDEPHVPRALIESPQAVLLPHVGSATARTRDAMGKLVADNLISWFREGRPLTPAAESQHLLRSASHTGAAPGCSISANGKRD